MASSTVVAVETFVPGGMGVVVGSFLFALPEGFETGAEFKGRCGGVASIVKADSITGRPPLHRVSIKKRASDEFLTEETASLTNF